MKEIVISALPTISGRSEISRWIWLAGGAYPEAWLEMSRLFRHFLTAAEQAGWDIETFEQADLHEWPELLREHGYDAHDDEPVEDCLQRIITDLTA